MGDKSGIEWTDATWNPVVGCSVVSPGCTNCYAMRLAGRLELMGGAVGAKYAGLTQASKAGPVWTGAVRLDEGALDQPLRWRRARRIFVNSMSDLFHADLEIHEIAQVFAVMAVAQQHVFQVLTKRAGRLRAVLEMEEFWSLVNSFATDLAFEHTDSHARRSDDYRASAAEGSPDTPLPNVWLGTSAEDQARADERIPHLLATPAAVHFVSAEPLLGPVRLDRIEEWVDTFEDCGGHPDPHWPLDTHDATWLDALRGRFDAEARSPDGCRRGDIDIGRWHQGAHLDWVIVGGESGAGARPMHPDWVRSLRDQCTANKVPFFFKQWGSWLVGERQARDGEGPEVMFPDGSDFWVVSDGHDIVLAAAEEHRGAPKQIWQSYWASGDGRLLRRAGKKAAGRLLDGRTWDEVP